METNLQLRKLRAQADIKTATMAQKKRVHPPAPFRCPLNHISCVSYRL